MRTFRFGGKRIFRRYRSRQLAKCEKIKIVALQRRENAQPGAAQVAAREGAPPRPSWAGAPLAHDAKGNGGCCCREGRHLYAVASHIQRIARSNCRARWNQQVQQCPPIVGWAVCLSGISARLDQASKLASSPPRQEGERLVPNPTKTTCCTVGFLLVEFFKINPTVHCTMSCNFLFSGLTDVPQVDLQQSINNRGEWLPPPMRMARA